MDREKLKQVAGYYFKEHMGAEPDSLTFTYEEHGTFEFNIKATFGERVFDIWMLPTHNRIRLIEIKDESTFEEAAELAGLDRNLNNLYGD